MGFSQYKAVEALKGLKAPDLTKSGYITPKRIEEMQIRVGALKLLYGTERVDAPICEALSHLAKEARVHEKMGRLQAMEVMNYVHGCESEERQVGHTAIRDPHPVSKAAKEAREAYQNELEKLRAFLPKIEKYKAMIVVGIGGSYLGTKAVYNALKAFQTNDRKVYFASNVDPDRVQAILEEVDIK